MSFVPLKKRGKALEWKLAASLEFPKGKNSDFFPPASPAPSLVAVMLLPFFVIKNHQRND